MFSQFLSTMAGTTQKKEKHHRSPLPYPGSAELSQGQTLLDDRLRMLNTVKDQFPLFEALTSNNPSTDGSAQKDLAALQTLETKFNQKLTDYSSKYKLFMEEYHSIIQGLASCKATCNSKYSKNEMKYQKGACLTGCDLDDARQGITSGVEMKATTQYEGKNISDCKALNTMDPQFCKQWVQTKNCDGNGELDLNSLFKQQSTGSAQCSTIIPSTTSGYCICADGTKKGHVDCGHQPFTCNQICQPGAGPFSYKTPSWPEPKYRKWTSSECLGDTTGCFKAANLHPTPTTATIKENQSKCITIPGQSTKWGCENQSTEAACNAVDPWRGGEEGDPGFTKIGESSRCQWNSATSKSMTCPSQYPYLLKYGPQNEFYCYKNSDGNTTGEGGLCNCDCTNCGTNPKFSDCSSLGATCAKTSYCQNITETNVNECVAKANANNKLAATKQMEIDVCSKLGTGWNGASGDEYGDPACCNPKSGVCCCLGNNCVGIKKCTYPHLKTKVNLPTPLTGKVLAGICQNAAFPHKGPTLAQRQQELTEANKELVELATQIYTKIKQLHGTRASMGKYSAQQRGNFQKQLAQYDKIRAELQQRQTQQRSLNAMLSDKQLQTSSVSMHYSVWLILAISGVAIALTKLSR